MQQKIRKGLFAKNVGLINLCDWQKPLSVDLGTLGISGTGVAESLVDCQQLLFSHPTGSRKRDLPPVPAWTGGWRWGTPAPLPQIPTAPLHRHGTVVASAVPPRGDTGIRGLVPVTRVGPGCRCSSLLQNLILQVLPKREGSRWGPRSHTAEEASWPTSR